MTRTANVLAALCILTAALALASPEKEPSSSLVQKLSAGGWTDDEILLLHAALVREGGDPSGSAALREAILSPTFPGEGRPDRFFDALASYFDDDRDGSYTLSEIESDVSAHAGRYADLLKESAASGPHQDLASMFRVKTWKMMQKIILLQHHVRGKGLAAWGYSPMTPAPPATDWDKENTLSDAADFRKRVCEASSAKPIVVKFGSTQCADCLLMEYTQGIHVAAEKSGAGAPIYKFWWGPNLPSGNDDLRKAEGVKYSPFFIVYRNGRRYPCGFAFLDDKGAGLEECLGLAMAAGATDAGACGQAS